MSTPQDPQPAQSDTPPVAEPQNFLVEVCNECGGLVGWEKVRDGVCPGGLACWRLRGTRFVAVAKMSKRAERLENALAFYADEEAYEWRKVTEEDDAPDWTAEDRENGETTTVHLDGGRRARVALND